MAIPNEVFSAALAHDFTVSAVNTWNPNIARSPRVLVPIEVTALAVRTAGGSWANCKMATPPSNADENNLAHAIDLLPAPFKNLDTPRSVGVYLHWAVPDALTRGTVSATDPKATEFPPLPDRWLIVRLSAGATPSRRAVRGWVLETGGATPKVNDLATWTEAVNPDDPPPLDVKKPLTVMGHGDAFWAAYFDNVENRLGFHDQFLDGVQGPLAYFVSGWH